VPPKPQLYWQMAVNVTKKVVRAPVSIHTWGALRRTILPQILPDELLYRWKPYRKGECNRCGACCKILFRCPFLATDDDGQYTCRIYDKRFAQCRLFPQHAQDLVELGGECSYTFSPEPSLEPEPALD
jgi:hypothetical protein